MTQVTLQGNTYSDDGSTPKDMLNGGHRNWFFPLVQDIVATADDVATDASNAAISAASASAVATAMKGTSTTSLSIGTGSKTLTTQTSKQFTVGNFLTVARTSEPTKLMHGVVTAYNSGTGSLTVNVTTIAGTGTYTDWSIAVSGAQGNTGLSGDGSVTYMSLSSGATLTTTDKAKIIDCNGTFTLAFQAAASLGSTWTTTIRNIGTGVITLDPNASETIEGSLTFSVASGQQVRVSSNGTSLVVISYTPNVLVSLPIFQNNSPYKARSVDEFVSTSIQTVTSSDDIACIFNTTSGLVAFPPGTTTGICYTTTDAVNWIARATGSSTGPLRRRIAVDGNRVLFSDGLTQGFLSTDGGVTWSAQTLPVADSDHVTSVSGVFMCVKGYTSYYTSATGLTGSWTTRSYNLPVVTGINGSAMAFLGITLLINVNGNNLLLTSTNDGVSWTATTNTSADTGVCSSGAGVFVGWNASNFISSTNGTSWTNRTANAGVVNRIQFINSLFVSVGTNNIWTSSDGITWTQRSSATDTHQDVAYGSSVYISVGNAGSVYTSSDAITWTAQPDVGTSDWYNIKFNGSIFVGVTHAGEVFTTTNGTSWASQGFIPSGTVTKHGLTVNGSTFVLVSNTDNINSMYTSTDGITWTVVDTSPFGVSNSSIFYLNGKYRGLDLNSYFASSDLVTWTGSIPANATSTSRFIRDATRLLLFHAGSSGKKYWSTTDCVTWTLRLLPQSTKDSNPSYSEGSVAFNFDSELVFLNYDNSRYYYSSNLSTWSYLSYNGPSAGTPPLKVSNMFVLRLGTTTDIYTGNTVSGEWTRRQLSASNYLYKDDGFVKFNNQYYMINFVDDGSLTKFNLTATGLFSS